MAVDSRLARTHARTVGRTALRMVTVYPALVFAGVVLTSAETLFGTRPFGLALCCAVTDSPLAAAVGVIAYSVYFGIETYPMVIAVAVAIFIRLIGAVASAGVIGFVRSGARFTDGIKTRILAAVLSPVVMSASQVVSGTLYNSAPTAAVFVTSVCVASTIALTFYFDARYRHTTYKDAGLIVFGIAVSIALSEYEIYHTPASLLFALIFAAAAGYSRGASVGAVAGLIAGIGCGIGYLPMTALFGFACGAFYSVGMPAGMLTSVALYFAAGVYIYGIEEYLVYLPPAVLAGPCVLILSLTGIIKPVKRLVPVLRDSSGDILYRLREQDGERRMEMISKTMTALSAMITGLTDKLRRPSITSFETMCRDVWRRNCSDCPNECGCHDMNSIPGDDVIDNIASRLLAGGKADRTRLNELTGAKCPKTDKITDELNDGAEKLVTDAIRADKTEIFASDYEATASIIADAVAQSNTAYTVDTYLTERLRRAFLREGLATENLIVCGTRKKFVIATGTELLNSGLGADDISRLCKKITGTDFGAPVFSIDGACASMTVDALPRFKVTYSGRQNAKDGEAVSGDSTATLENRDGYFYSVICDGMGSGEEAAFTARICKVFLEKMLECSNSKTTALKMLNTFIRNKGIECFASIDLLEIDLMLGRATFQKNGAAPSYVLRGHDLFKITASTFPVGIVKDISGETTEFDIDDGDVIIMCSDGVAQDFDVSASLDPTWFVTFLEDEWTDDLEIMAERISHAATVQNHRRDDITVQLIRVERVGEDAKPKIRLKSTELTPIKSS
ncbi:MAG: SpoIIE family protein phosphatase [Clostridia bacterium]|nr:SpoIIE family protein phosphatase [Clostridia bacterium]